MLRRSWLGFLHLGSLRPPARRRQDARRLHVERLEERDCPSGSYLLVADWGGDRVLRYDGTTGTFVDTFVPKHSGGMNQPYGVLFGPHDNDLYVSTGRFAGPGQLKAVLRYDGTTGAFEEKFTNGGDLQHPVGIIFGPDGNLYVGTGTDGLGGRIARYDGTTGAFLGDFVTDGSGGLRVPTGLVFGPSGRNPARLDLYVSSAVTNSVLRYDGITGDFIEEFVVPGSGGLDAPIGLTFGPDGNLYVASSGFIIGEARAVLRFQGPSGPTPGAFLNTFVSTGSGGLQTPWGLIFGPDGNNDGRFDLYVTNSELEGGSFNGKNGTVKRYDGLTGAFVDTFVAARSGQLDDPQFLTFTGTDPVTLAYTGTNASVSDDGSGILMAPVSIVFTFPAAHDSGRLTNAISVVLPHAPNRSGSKATMATEMIDQAFAGIAAHAQAVLGWSPDLAWEMELPGRHESAVGIGP